MAPHDINAILSLTDWRIQMAALYQRVSASDDLEQTWLDFVKERERLYSTHSQSPLRSGAQMAFFAYDTAFSFVVSLIPLPETNSLKADGGKDGIIDFKAVAKTQGLADTLGKELTLYQLMQYGGGLFLPFGDSTNGKTSYGGGRYLLDSAKSAWLGMRVNKIRLDFNFAYFPSCAHDTRYICPLSPSENHVDMPITAGECWAS